ncbi:MAG: hypothetical protein JNJ61_29530 [Anaerolineae bacterium]|nr:hypothetical protein [Anaerolineae bacterium]
MKIAAEEAIIPREKLTHYLLLPQVRNDKSRFLAQAGFTQANPDALEAAIRQILAENEAVQDREDEYGRSYRVAGALVGPDGALAVITVWMHGSKTQQYRFITLKPNKE